MVLKEPRVETTQTASRNKQLHVKSLKGNIIQPQKTQGPGATKWAWRTLSSERSHTYRLQIIWTHYTDNSTVYEPVETENCRGGSWTRKDENLEDNEETKLTGDKWQKCFKVMVMSTSFSDYTTQHRTLCGTEWCLSNTDKHSVTPGFGPYNSHLVWALWVMSPASRAWTRLTSGFLFTEAWVKAYNTSSRQPGKSAAHGLWVQ